MGTTMVFWNLYYQYHSILRTKLLLCLKLKYLFYTGLYISLPVVMLDISAAFDLLEHGILLEKL